MEIFVDIVGITSQLDISYGLFLNSISSTWVV